MFSYLQSITHISFRISADGLSLLLTTVYKRQSSPQWFGRNLISRMMSKSYLRLLRSIVTVSVSLISKIAVVLGLLRALPHVWQVRHILKARTAESSLNFHGNISKGSLMSAPTAFFLNPYHLKISRAILY
jgi:hypothetical protein